MALGIALIISLISGMAARKTGGGEPSARRKLPPKETKICFGHSDSPVCGLGSASKFPPTPAENCRKPTAGSRYLFSDWRRCLIISLISGRVAGKTGGGESGQRRTLPSEFI
jgi:hypothetical protein